MSPGERGPPKKPAKPPGDAAEDVPVVRPVEDEATTSDADLATAMRVIEELPSTLDTLPASTDELDALMSSTAEAPSNWEPGAATPTAADAEKYTVEAEIGRGGMGAIYRVEDRALNRHLAMKVLLHQKAGERPSPESGEPDLMQRFLEEAQVTAQLDHPGVVPVHELGIDKDGRAFFTMSLVRGATLSHVFKSARAGKDGWDLTRALGTLQRVCETVAFAHDKGVIHRDLKPANVMVGKFGEAYVMDWGLAKVRGAAAKPIASGGPPSEEVRTLRQSGENVSDGALETQVGRVMGTPAYMPPEQADGRLDEVDERSDVYALGAMLYQLLAGHPPYVTPGTKVNSAKLLAAVVGGAPEAVLARAKDTPPELASVVDKAMARDPAARYQSAAELAKDLQRFLSGRVVRAYRTGPLVELQKWIMRNRAVAGTVAAAVLLIVVLTAAFLRSLSDERDEATRQRDEAHRQRMEKTEALEEVFRLADAKKLQDLRAEASALWPVHPDRADAMRAWVERGEALVGNLEGHRGTLSALEWEALPYTDEQRAGDHPEDTARVLALQTAYEEATDAAERARIDGELAAAEVRLTLRKTWSFASEERGWQHDVLSDLVAGIEGLADEKSGLIAVMRKRLDKADGLRRRTLEEPGELWRTTIAALVDERANPAYGGLRIAPQLGLVPLGKDPGSGLFEFAHVTSGDVPTRGPGEQLALDDQTCIVLVLIPPTRCWAGAQDGVPDGPNYDPEADEREGPVHEVTLSAYFVSKYETTQAQWWELTGGTLPSSFKPLRTSVGKRITWRNPVESVTWEECDRWMRRHNLSLPSEAQWEHACRAGGTSRWSGAGAPHELQANVADAYLRDNGGPAEWPYTIEINDGHGAHAPVGTYPPNPFGLYDMHGNVWEWCLDWFGPYTALPARDPVVTVPSDTKVKRGGAWDGTAILARTANRYHLEPNARVQSVGFRAARALDPAD